ncbi:septal ring lytic transglycosylase RlpA family protein [Sphingomonas sp. SUN039]|uniref:septal ring lytic transglycosylase RlpA family protein n=1 Tax=Sphingomonas sp. SUN039 TaxID=2937787 RepID=UPI002164AD68|nr:septal ring lytic transglycosylase RlpA family protein [Sphingomonas sp. SUN039]UVO53498.1 septal ring lytic transglycosylase RlpA family protein [Sphingomonas sp. SUN039]
MRAEPLLAGLLLASCVGAPEPRTASRPPVYRAPASDNFVKVGATYSAGGNSYTPRDDRDYDETGMASWYGEELRGSRTANGEPFDPDGFTAAHRTLPLPSYVEVTSLESGRAILVRINDRGPFHGNRIIDLSLGAARQLGITARGAHQVRVRRVEPDERDKLSLRRGQPVMLRGGRIEPQRALATAKMPVGPGPFFLQVASFSSEQRARTMAERLGADVSQIAGTWRVRLGPYNSAERAMAALAPLAARGYPDAVITR